ncbi:MAG TPA: glycosyltransferase family 2 protein [Gaiellaceae bacterium]|nr:glycosyltransferase family 2 protein [Gaiellaceae bacterium]
MKLVQTLQVRDEADVVGSQIAYHLNAGVDFVIAFDHDSQDGTTDILESFARDGYLRRLSGTGEIREGTWRTQMARLAAVEHGADWVFHTDADEFWMPTTATLRESFEAVPTEYGIVWALTRHFPPRPGDDGPFSERMTVRISLAAALNDPTSPYRPHAKVGHRADPEVIVRYGGHTAVSASLRGLSGWYVAEVFHFPNRTLAQYERKGSRGARARGYTPLGQYVRVSQALESGTLDERYRTLMVDDQTLSRGVAEGSLVVDMRLRDALRELDGGQRDPTMREERRRLDEGLIAESAALREANVVRLTRDLDELERRAQSL